MGCYGNIPNARTNNVIIYVGFLLSHLQILQKMIVIQYAIMTPYGESEEQEAISRIVFYRDTGSDSNCGWDCARDCSDRIRYNQSLRTALFAAE